MLTADARVFERLAIERYRHHRCAIVTQASSIARQSVGQGEVEDRDDVAFHLVNARSAALNVEYPVEGAVTRRARSLVVEDIPGCTYRLG